MKYMGQADLVSRKLPNQETNNWPESIQVYVQDIHTPRFFIDNIAEDEEPDTLYNQEQEIHPVYIWIWPETLYCIRHKYS